MFSGKRTRIPTQKAVESELDLSQIIIKNEVPDPSDVSIPITVSEEATVTVAPMASPEKTTTKIIKIDESDKELPELHIAEDTPVQADINM